MSVFKSTKQIKKFLAVVAIVNLAALAGYYAAGWHALSQSAMRQPDEINRAFYYNVFSNLPYALAGMIVVFTLLAIFFNKLYRILTSKKIGQNAVHVFAGIYVFFSLIMVFMVNTVPISDAAFYVSAGSILHNTGEYRNAAGNLTAYWPVGLPFILSVFQNFGPNYLMWIKLLNVLNGCALIYIAYYLVRDELAPSQRIIFLAVFTLFPSNLFSSNAILTDYIASMLLYSAVFLFLKKSWHSVSYILIGALLAAASYMRPTFLLYLVLFIILKFKMNPKPVRILHIFLMISVFVICVAPWIARNYAVFRGFVPMATNGGFNFLMGNHSASDGGVNFNFNYDINAKNELEESSKAYRAGFQSIINSPFRAVLRLPAKIFYSLRRGDSTFIWSFKSTGNYIPPVLLSLLFLITNIYYYLVLILAAAGWYSVWGKQQNKKLGSVFFYLTAFNFLLILIYVGGDRYLIPVYPILVYYCVQCFPGDLAAE